MDTGATSHLTVTPGTLSRVFNNSTICSLLVCNGSHIPITACCTRTITLPHCQLYLHNTLVAPHIIKILVPVLKFTTDNNVSVDFDPYIFMRCNSYVELYPITGNVVTP
ncbi:unnamed protein product, partial [Cuscuta europaea]